jgi:hypothetical protein
MLTAIALYPSQLDSHIVTAAHTLLVAMLVPAKCIMVHELDAQGAYMSSWHLASLPVHSRFGCSSSIHWFGQASRPPIDLAAQLVNSAAPLVDLNTKLVNLAPLRSIWSFIICHLVDSAVSLLNPGGGRGTVRRRCCPPGAPPRQGARALGGVEMTGRSALPVPPPRTSPRVAGLLVRQRLSASARWSR